MQQLFHVKQGHAFRLFESSKGFQSFTRTRMVRAFLNADGDQEQEETSYSYTPRATEKERCMFVVQQ